jgi:hypothetical protein
MYTSGDVCKYRNKERAKMRGGIERERAREIEQTRKEERTMLYRSILLHCANLTLNIAFSVYVKLRLVLAFVLLIGNILYTAHFSLTGHPQVYKLAYKAIAEETMADKQAICI